MQIITRNAAKEQGLKRYFTNEPCKNGHIAERQVSSNACKVCAAARDKAYKAANAEKIAASQKAYYAANIEKIAANRKAHYAANAEKIKSYYAANIEKIKAYDAANAEKIAANKKAYYAANIEKIKAHYAANAEKIAANKKAYYAANTEKAKAYYAANIEKIAAHINARYKANPQFKMAAILRTRFRNALRTANATKAAQTLEILGTTIGEARAHLEAQFKLGMTWDNWGLHGWHLDHIRPCSSFDLTDPDQQKACFHYSNLQPLWAAENLSKGDRLDWVPAEA